MNIAVIGLGKLGAPLAVTLAQQDFRVIGIDTSPEVVRAINDRRPHIQETGYADALASVSEIIATTDYGAVSDASVVIIIVTTPSLLDGSFSNDYIIDVCKHIAPVLQGALVIISSTVMPTSCSDIFEPILNRGVCYSPEFIALGNVLNGLSHPDFVLLGESDSEIGDRAEIFFRRWHGWDIPIRRMSLVSAELAKIALNSYITLKMTWANELGRLCESIPGTDIDAITQAVGLDRRIGREYLRAGAAFGGPCFPRDGRALIRVGENHGVHTYISRLVDYMNNDLSLRVAQLAKSLYTDGFIGIYGIAYKLKTSVTEESMGLKLAEYLKEYPIILYDPLIIGTDAELDKCDIVIVTLPYREFTARPGQTIIDCWRSLDEDKIMAAGATYLALGRHI